MAAKERVDVTGFSVLGARERDRVVIVLEVTRFFLFFSSYQPVKIGRCLQCINLKSETLMSREF